MKQDLMSDPEAMAIVSFSLLEMVFNLLILKNVLTREEVKKLLLGYSSHIDAESTKARESGKIQIAAVFRNMEDLLIGLLERLDVPDSKSE